MLGCALAIAVALAACGGSSGPTKSEYAARADAICKEAQEHTTPLIRQLASSATSLTTGGAAGAHQVTGMVQNLHSVAAGYLTRLESLKQPSGDHAAIEQFLTPLSHVVTTIGQASTVLASGQPQQGLALLLQQAQPEAQRVASAAQSYGLTQCGMLLSALG